MLEEVKEDLTKADEFVYNREFITGIEEAASVESESQQEHVQRLGTTNCLSRAHK